MEYVYAIMRDTGGKEMSLCLPLYADKTIAEKMMSRYKESSNDIYILQKVSVIK